MAEDEITRYHHWLNGYESEQTPGNSEGQGGLACYSPWGWIALIDWTAAADEEICPEIILKNNC